MRRLRWRMLRSPDPERRYVVSVGVFEVDRFRRVPAFLFHTFRVRRALPKIPGLVGFALVADFRRRRFTECSAFESAEAMQGLRTQPAHAAAMAAMVPHSGPNSKFVRTEVYGRDLPLRAEAATAALERAGAGASDGGLQGPDLARPRPHDPA